MKNNVLIAFSTCADSSEGRILAKDLVESGLAACVNLVPNLTSVYRWQGQIQSDDECLMIIKTSEGSISALREWILKRHPYELPELVAVPVADGLPAYLQWVTDQIRR
jgi:periplasmic divalent cation tolerance protein